MDTNCRFIRVSKGKVEVPQDYPLGQDLTVHIQGTVVKEEITDNHDGTADKTFVVKAVTMLVD
jgi:hypothetical protein